MKTSPVCPKASSDTVSGLLDAADPAAIPSLQTNHPPLRVAHKCLKEKCPRWQQNRCAAAKKMLEALQEKESTHLPR